MRLGLEKHQRLAERRGVPKRLGSARRGGEGGVAERQKPRQSRETAEGRFGMGQVAGRGRREPAIGFEQKRRWTGGKGKARRRQAHWEERRAEREDWAKQARRGVSPGVRSPSYFAKGFVALAARAMN